MDIRSLSPAQLNCREEKMGEFVKATVVTASVKLYESWFGRRYLKTSCDGI